jgi:ABC-2 type transport system ATP-binding protein
MPDFPPLYDDLLAWEFLDLFAASYDIPRRQRPEVIERYLELVGLTEKRNASVVELSRGMRQRLMLAKTLIPRPRVLLLDEPASGVDPQGRIDLKNILRRLAAEGRTVLVSSHILAEMTEFCTAVAIMERGRMVVSGRIDEVNERILGAAILAVEVLGDAEALARIVGDDPRAGPIERRGEAFEFRFRGDAEAASDAAGRPGARRGARRVVRAPPRGPRGAVPESRRQGALVMRRPAEWLDNPVLVKHARSRLRRRQLIRSSRWC